MPLNVQRPLSQIEVIYRHYAALAATVPLDKDSGLGGKLLYAGDINATGCDLLRAANIAGAASLAASADVNLQRQAMREGAVDFLVTSLEEALRILKNEIRKRQTVSVGIALDPDQLAAQMIERGVLPDLLPADLSSACAETFLKQGARRILEEQVASDEPMEPQFVTWSVDREAARWLPRFDACAQAVVPADDLLRQRWLRLAPRYLGRMTYREHGVSLSLDEEVRLEIEFNRLVTAEPGDEASRPVVRLRNT